MQNFLAAGACYAHFCEPECAASSLCESLLPPRADENFRLRDNSTVYMYIILVLFLSYIRMCPPSNKRDCTMYACQGVIMEKEFFKLQSIADGRANHWNFILLSGLDFLYSVRVFAFICVGYFHICFYLGFYSSKQGSNN